MYLTPLDIVHLAIAMSCSFGMFILLTIIIVENSHRQERTKKPQDPPPKSIPPEKGSIAWESAQQDFNLDQAALETFLRMSEAARRNQTDFTTRNHPENDPAYRSVEFPDEFPP